MPKPLFFELSEEKRHRVEDAILNEFSVYSFNDSSTNRIVKEASISKGSLFKYFENKEDIYFYMLDTIIDGYVRMTQNYSIRESDTFYDSILSYAELEFDWYCSNPSSYKMMKKAFKEPDESIQIITRDRYAIFEEGLYGETLRPHSQDLNKIDLKMQTDILKWCINGFSESFIREIGKNEEISVLKENYLDELTAYLVIMKRGF